MGAELTVRQKILLAAATLGNETDAFPVEELIVKSWELYPESFSLRGYHGVHPDSNRVLAKLSGTDGLCGLGWLEHVDSRRYRITRKGRALAKQLAAMQAGTATGPQPVPSPSVPPPAPTPKAEPPPRRETSSRGEPPAPKAEPPARAEPAPARTERVEKGPALTTQDVTALVQVARTDALRKFLRGQPLSFTDACTFWGISTTGRPGHVQQRIDETADLLKRAVEQFGEGHSPDPRLPTLSTVYGMFNLHRLMLEKFAREIDALRLPAVG